MAETERTADLDYEFAQDWFSESAGIWDQLVAQWKPSRVVETGSFEGRSAV